MSHRSITIALFILLSTMLTAQTVWKKGNGTVTFTKAAFADWKQAANQDRISDSVWITRASTQSIFNIRKDTAYASNAPSGTTWAIGTTDSFSTYTYKTFVSLSGGSPQGLVGKDLVLHLVAEDIYLDIKFTSYVGGNTGGAFEYVRAKRPGTSSVAASAPLTFGLEQNYPNPFNPATTIGFTIERTGAVGLTISNIIGQTIATLVDGEVLEAGVRHQRQFNASGLASGVYFARLESGGLVQMKRLMLVK